MKTSKVILIKDKDKGEQSDDFERIHLKSEGNQQ